MDDASGGGGGGGGGRSDWPPKVTDMADATIGLLDDINDDYVHGAGPSGSGSPMFDHDAKEKLRAKIVQFAGPHVIDASADMSALLEESVYLVAANIEYALGDTRSKVDSNWEGDAANEFTTFISRMMDATEQHKDVLREVKAAMDVYHESAEAIGKDLAALVDDYQKALSGGLSASIDVLSVASFLAGLANPVKTTLDKVSSIISGLSAAKTISASDPGGVYDSFIDALDKLRKKADKRIEEIIEVFEAISDHLQKDKTKDILKPEKPSIITEAAFDPDEFMPREWDDFESANDGVSTEPLVDTKS